VEKEGKDKLKTMSY